MSDDRHHAKGAHVGGWMTYQRMRARNGTLFRKPDGDPDPYWRGPDTPPGVVGVVNASNLIGDMNRMERDYLTPTYPEAPFAARGDGTSPAEECAAAIGVDIETVRKVLRYVFLDQT